VLLLCSLAANESSNIFIHFGLCPCPTIATSLFSILAKLSQKEKLKIENAQMKVSREIFNHKLLLLLLILLCFPGQKRSKLKAKHTASFSPFI
jgi:hypothetical protein